MSSTRLRLRRASFSLNLLKHDVFKNTPGSPGIHLASSSATLTPDLQQSTSKSLLSAERVSRVGNYLLTSEATTTSHSKSFTTYEAVSLTTQETFTCKVCLTSDALYNKFSVNSYLSCHIFRCVTTPNGLVALQTV
jgi:hypothetical protein